MLKTALERPIPRATVPTATIANPFSRRTRRIASRRSSARIQRCWPGASIATDRMAPRAVHAQRRPLVSRRRSTKTRVISLPYSSRYAAG
jgi:hypothetical protein